MRHNLREFLIDPSTGQYSMSRLGIGFVTFGLYPAGLALEVCGIKPDWTALSALAASLATVYTFNSALGAWKRKGWEEKDEG